MSDGVGRVFQAGIGLVVVALVAVAAYLVPTPEDARPVFNLIAVGSGLAGYWIGSDSAFSRVVKSWKIWIACGSIFGLPILSYFYIWYYNVPNPDLFLDLTGYTAFSIVFATICFLFGVLQINLTERPVRRQ